MTTKKALVVIMPGTATWLFKSRLSNALASWNLHEHQKFSLQMNLDKRSGAISASRLRRRNWYLLRSSDECDGTVERTRFQAGPNNLAGSVIYARSDERKRGSKLIKFKKTELPETETVTKGSPGAGASKDTTAVIKAKNVSAAVESRKILEGEVETKAASNGDPRLL
jgi:hypothetical protein